jgi:hypothetical protein
MAPTDRKSQTFEVRLHFANAFPPFITSPLCGH